MTDAASQLRRFGRSFAALIALFFGLIVPFLFSLDYPWWPWIVGGITWLIAELRPLGLRWVEKTWLQIGHVLGSVMTPVLLGVVFFLLITPLGLLKRLAGASKIERKWQDDVSSYRSPPTIKTDLRDPF